MTTVFGGTEQETRDLIEAIRRSCTCFTVDGVPDGTCSAHRLMTDQRALNGLLYARRARRARLLAVEHHPLAEFDVEQKGPGR